MRMLLVCHHHGCYRLLHKNFMKIIKRLLHMCERFGVYICVCMRLCVCVSICSRINSILIYIYSQCRIIIRCCCNRNTHTHTQNPHRKIHEYIQPVCVCVCVSAYNNRLRIFMNNLAFSVWNFSRILKIHILACIDLFLGLAPFLRISHFIVSMYLFAPFVTFLVFPFCCSLLFCQLFFFLFSFVNIVIVVVCF